MIYYPPGGDGAPRVRPDDMTRAGAKRLRRAARGARGTARGRSTSVPGPDPRDGADRQPPEGDAR